MAFEGLTEKLNSAFKKLRSKGKLTEADVKEAMREVRLALLEADVNYKVAKDFTNKVTERAIGSQVMESLTPAQMVIKIVNEEMTALMGGEQSRLSSAPHPPTVVMMCGLQGSGKTTHAAKLTMSLKKAVTDLFWLRATFTDRLLLNSFRLSAARQACLFLKWVRAIRLKLPRQL